MKKILILAALFAAQMTMAQKPAIPRDEKIEQRVEATLKKMTLDEKVGQMLELNMDGMGKITVENGKPVWKLSEQTLDTVISKWKIGSILNVPMSRAATIAQWQEWIRLIQKKSMKYIGIPDIYGLDQNHGVTYTQGGTIFPQKSPIFFIPPVRITTAATATAIIAVIIRGTPNTSSTQLAIVLG